MDGSIVCVEIGVSRGGLDVMIGQLVLAGDIGVWSRGATAILF